MGVKLPQEQTPYVGVTLPSFMTRSVRTYLLVTTHCCYVHLVCVTFACVLRWCTGVRMCVSTCHPTVYDCGQYDGLVAGRTDTTCVPLTGCTHTPPVCTILYTMYIQHHSRYTRPRNLDTKRGKPEETASPFWGLFPPSRLTLSTNHPIDPRSVSERLVFSTARAG